jgi:hypothetical protein
VDIVAGGYAAPIAATCGSSCSSGEPRGELGLSGPDSGEELFEVISIRAITIVASCNGQSPEIR